jgi:RNA polymerase sigma-70 factor (ECF subfamily)
MAGSADEWTVWLAERGPALLLFARQWLPAFADAEDVVQEAFVRFWQARHNAADPAAYLFACVKNCALDRLRGDRRRTRREEAAARPEGESSWFVPELEQDERRVAIEAALRLLPEEQRLVLLMKVWGALSFLQIAEALGVPANTAASRYRYAIAKLRELLAEQPIR